MTQQATQHKPLRHKITDVLLVLALLTLVPSAIIEVISWMVGFAYPFLDRLIYPFYVAMLGSAISPLYAWKKDSTGPAQGGSATVTTWQDAEASARNFMRANGHPDARLTPPGPDGGVDVVAAGAIAQVKFYAKPTGSPAIVQLAGTTMKRQYRDRKALFFASSGYTAQGLAAARDLGVELYELRGGRRWVRVR